MQAKPGFAAGESDDMRLTMADGLALYVRDWPLADARGAVLLVHGLGEHSGRYQALADWFRRHGYAVRGYDHRGHGRSPGARGALTHDDDLLSDLATVYRHYADAAAHAPLLLGHSMGGLVALRTVLDGRLSTPALVLSSPALRAHSPRWLQRLAHGLARVVPNLPLHNGLPASATSHDPAVVGAYQMDALRTARITPRLADFIFRAGPACIADAGHLDVPTLLLAAGSDKLVDPSGSRAFAAGARATGRLTARFFDTLYHELFNEAEPGRSQVLKQLDDWLSQTRL
ncbi:lysophospholipase [Dyella sp. A6]|uniref:alpha/beta hydrolase n=1 Tax=Dyella aluminiiresistens TaxID=3069105 RepID=UPI002E787835|nr:lysophospholipase [Dyella sp. A6]